MDHRRQVKPYSLSPVIALGDGTAGFEVGVLAQAALSRFLGAAEPGRPIRLGRHHTNVASEPVLLAEAAWSDLAVPTGDWAWALRCVSPVSFRTGNHSGPMPDVTGWLRGLAVHWSTWTACESVLSPSKGMHRQLQDLWITDIDGQSDVVKMNGIHYSGFVGRLRFQCSSEETAARVGPLFELAPYAGVGSATPKGLGWTRLEPTWQPRSRSGSGRPSSS